MKKQINEEIKRMQKIAGIVKESLEEAPQGGQGKVKVGSVTSPEWKGLVQFIAKNDGLTPEYLEDYSMELRFEDSAIIYAEGYRIHLAFTARGTYIDIDGSDKIFFYKDYTFENFKSDFGQQEAASATDQGQE